MNKRFTEEKITGILKDAEPEMKFVEVFKKRGIPAAMYYE